MRRRRRRRSGRKKKGRGEGNTSLASMLDAPSALTDLRKVSTLP